MCVLEGGGHTSFGLLSSLTLAGGKGARAASSVQDPRVWRKHGCKAVQGSRVAFCGCCLGCKICFSLWGMYHFPKKKEKCARDRATQRRPDVPHFLFLKKFKAILTPGQNLEIVPGCAVIAVPGKTNFSSHAFRLLHSKITTRPPEAPEDRKNLPLGFSQKEV